MIGETSYEIRWGSSNLVKSSLCIIYLFASEVKKKVSTCSVNQMPIVRPPPFTRTQISYTRKQQPPHSRAINLCSRWPHYEQPRLHSLFTWMLASSCL